MAANFTRPRSLTPNFLPELREAAAKNNGRPLTVGQRERVILRARFLQVTRLAGYEGTQIVEKHFEDYMTNVPEFEKMLEDYELRYTGMTYKTMQAKQGGGFGV